MLSSHRYSARSSRLGLGSYVGLRFANGGESEVRLVENKTSRHDSTVDTHSSLGRVLVGARVGDKVNYSTSEGNEEIIVISVRHGC